MLEMFKPTLTQLDKRAPKLTAQEIIAELRGLPFPDFAEILSLPHPYQNIASKLPKPENDEVQLHWTGDKGVRLLGASIDFVRNVHDNFQNHAGRDFKTVLDFGVGWGRLARLFYYYTDPADYYGLDPAEPSHERLRENNLLGNFETSDYLFKKNPFSKKFDLIFAFSVFTHISPDYAKQALDTLADSLTEDGLLAVTIRPIEYWTMREADGSIEPKRITALKKDHNSTGVAFDSHDGGLEHSGYGDTSFTVPAFAKLSDKLEIANIDRSLSDSVQLYVYLRRKK